KYKDHKKSGVWYQYNDSGKVVKKESFEIDTAESQNTNKETKHFSGNQESIYKQAEFKGGNKELRNHIFHNFNVDIASPKLEDEQAKIGFTIDSSGSVKNLHIVQSANFAFDQEALRIISIMPKWEPASVNGKPVPSLHVQSITMFDY
ncbi:MAG TPA: energy transducer TonB, partial [Ferruginibacter sp.]|nr:energy transducer TonB [Ferruginibacter sp.]